MIKVEIFNIQYEVSDSLGIENFSLPSTLIHTFDCDKESIEEEISNYISDHTGFCHLSFEYNILPSRIAITPFEFKMLIEGYHPEFSTSEDQGEFVEQGKGADVIFQKTATRLSDNKTFVFSYVHNTEGSWNHDHVHDGDFFISHTKKDELDPFNELQKDDENKDNNEVKERSIFDIYEDIKDELSNFDPNKPIINPTELATLFKAYLELHDAKKFHEFKINIMTVAVEHKIEVESIRGFFVVNETKFNKAMETYTEKYNKLHKIKTKISIKSVEFDLTVDEIKALRKQLSAKF